MLLFVYNCLYIILFGPKMCVLEDDEDAFVALILMEALVADGFIGIPSARCNGRCNGRCRSFSMVFRVSLGYDLHVEF